MFRQPPQVSAATSSRAGAYTFGSRAGRVLGLLMLQMALHAPAHCAAIRGAIHVPSAAIRGASFGSTGGASGAWSAVIYLDSIPTGLERSLAYGCRDTMIVQVDGRFVPRILPVAVGARVCFRNMDGADQDVYSVSPPKRFTIDGYGPGRSRTVCFDRPGVVELSSRANPGAKGFLLVTPNHAFARPDPVGGFVLPAVPPGRYLISYWHPDFGMRSRTVTLPAHGDLVLDLGF